MRSQCEHTAGTGLTEAQLFYASVFRDDRSSNAVLATRRGPLWSERCIPCSQLPSLASVFLDRNDRYVTVNGFVGRRRDAASCRQVNAFVVDIDCHGGDGAEAVRSLLAGFDEAVGCGAVPSPTVAVATGRGLQLLYVLERSISCRLADGSPNERSLAFFSDVRGMLYDALEARLSSRVAGAELDRSVSDLSRVVRIPGSFNSAAGRRARLLFADGPVWDLAGLKASLLPLLPGKKRGGVSKRPAKLDRLNASRMRKVRELVALRDSRGQLEGTRDLCLFVYYNAAKQVLGSSEAKQRTHALNQSTSCPLPADDVNRIARTVDSVKIQHGAHRGEAGYYPMTAETVADKLCLTAEEVDRIGFFASKRSDDRAAAKLATRKRRAARDNGICRLYGNGLSQAEVAERVGCSVRTVSKVVSRERIAKGSLKMARTAGFKAALSLKKKQVDSGTGNYAFFCHTSRCVPGPPANPAAPSNVPRSLPYLDKDGGLLGDASCGPKGEIRTLKLGEGPGDPGGSTRETGLSAPLSDSCLRVAQCKGRYGGH